jgi:hypothetical protein
MSGLPATLDPSQLAAIASATSQDPQGQSGNTINQDITSSLTSSGYFDPSQLAALSSDGITGSSPWGSSQAAPGWDQQVQNAIGSAAPAAPAAPQTLSSAPAAPANPLQPSYLPAPPSATPTTYSAATYNNTYNPATATSELNQAAGVQDQQQQQNLMSMLAAQGISPGSSAAQAAGQNLSTTQNAALDPTLASAQEYGAGLNEQSGLSNASALNSAGSQNASASNTDTLQNLQNLLQSQEFNASAYNNAGSTSAGYANQDYLAQLEAQLGLQQQGLSTSGSLAGDQANQTVPLNPSLFSDITSGAQAFAP